jgi:hypothetical protein
MIMIGSYMLLTKQAKPPTVSVTRDKTHGQHTANNQSISGKILALMSWMINDPVRAHLSQI